ncbi:MAG: hypothetical protein KTR25_13095 [Myxococcales bacterium]|nr:hypothetical protein [Myxococcales bacterium]
MRAGLDQQAVNNNAPSRDAINLSRPATGMSILVYDTGGQNQNSVLGVQISARYLYCSRAMLRCVTPC